MMLPPDGLESWNSALIREMPCALVGVGGDGRVAIWNPAAERLLGYARTEALGKPWSEFLVDRGAGDESGWTLKHRQGHDVHVVHRLVPEGAPGNGRAFFLEPTSKNLVDATALVIREVLQQLPAYFSIIGTDLRYRLVCQSCEILFGRPRRDIEGQSVRDMFGNDAYAQVQPLLQRALAGEPAHGEFHALGADGRVHFLRVHLQPLRPGAGGVAGIFAFAYDISELRETETTLRDSEARLKYLIQNYPDLVVIVDRDLKLRFINHTGPDPATPPESIIGMNVLEFTPHDYRDWMRSRYDLAWSTGEPVDYEIPIVWNGQQRWFSSRLVCLPNGGQPPVEILCVSRETTRRVLVEQALRDSELQFRLFAEALEDVVWIHDANPERVVFVNESFERIWGMPRQRLYDDSRAWTDAIHPDDRTRVADSFQAMLGGAGGSFDIEYRIVRTDGSLRWIHDYGVALRDENGRVVRVTGIARDITARKLADDEKQAFQRQLLETQKLESLGVLAGGIAHDFNNLLSGILGNVNLAQLSAADPALRAHLEQIETISLRAGDLCKQMLAYAGKGQFVVAVFDLNALIDEISHLVNISISKKVSLQLQQSAGLPAIHGDASQIRQVLLNLVINASEAFGDRVGAIRIATGQTVLLADDLATFHFGAELAPGPFVFLEVSDNGPGMTAEVVERIFEPFFTTKFTGRGLGLAAVQGIMRSHGGAVRVVSKIGKGTVFTLLLPPATDALPAVVEPAAVAAPLRAKGEALIVDDEDAVRTTLSAMLESFGFTVLAAANGREAIHLFETHHRQLKFVLLDLTMPVLSGEECHVEFVRIDPTVPVIFISGYMEQELADRFHGHPVAGFLQKPFRMEALEKLIGKVLSSSGTS